MPDDPASKRFFAVLPTLASNSTAVCTFPCTTTCNAAFLRMMGFADAKDVIGRKLHDVIHHSHPDGSHYSVDDCPIYIAARTGTPAFVEEEQFFPIVGEPLWVTYRATPIVQDGEQRGAICTFQDIGEKRSGERQRRGADERRTALLQLGDAFRNMEDAAAMAGAAAETVGRALALDAAGFARRQALKAEVFDVSVNIATIRDMLASLTGSRVGITVDVPPGPHRIKADRSQFDTALVNMAVNARDAMGGEGRLAITVRNVDCIPAVRSHPIVPGQFVSIAIADTGAGITPDQIDRIFEPFYTTKGVGHGTGLGLSQVFGFSHMLGGYCGGQAEYLRVPMADIGPIKIPDSVTDDQALFLSDIFPTGYMAAENAQIEEGDTRSSGAPSSSCRPSRPELSGTF